LKGIVTPSADNPIDPDNINESSVAGIAKYRNAFFVSFPISIQGVSVG
jgi:hypothetical protein